MVEAFSINTVVLNIVVEGIAEKIGNGAGLTTDRKRVKLISSCTRRELFERKARLNF